MKVEKFDYNDIEELFANTYIVSDDNGNAVIIDPSVDNDRVGDYIVKNSLTPKAILLTHGHFDHIRGIDRLAKRFSIPLYLHYEEKDFLIDPYLNCSDFDKELVVTTEPIVVTDGEELRMLDDTIKVIHTPFHTEGSACYYFLNNNLLFTGDTLFKMSIGRSDLPTGDSRKIESSLSKLKTLPKETKIYPGHGPNSTLGFELMLNNFFKF